MTGLTVMARPPLDIKTRTYNILLAEAQYDWLMRHAYRQGISGAAVIRGLLDELRKRAEDRRAIERRPSDAQPEA